MGFLPLVSNLCRANHYSFFFYLNIDLKVIKSEVCSLLGVSHCNFRENAPIFSFLLLFKYTFSGSRDYKFYMAQKSLLMNWKRKMGHIT